ncbi:Peptidyl-prolyl cis-trans isomerase CWC27 like protein [Eufriesea mexicana]|uniref:Peptidyl-prolyl cis-trans isomerase n=1 Tax=Eufriesea mexicana TaxID=516756 RepID=A0A310SNL9_9HYME|nr:Peptidyl-prolyl cis-trans isomerase CWC27 like protein [Eufriesea mexicana]
MRIIEEMENEQLIIVMKGKVKLNIECKCCIKAIMSSNIYRDLDTIKEEVIIVLWHIMDFIGPIKSMSKRVKRIIKGVITRGGDSTSTGEGGKIYGESFKEEFHTRLRFCRRDLIAMANAGKDDNSSQFFLTLSSTPDLQNKHTIFEFSPDSIILYNEKFCYRDFNLLSFGEEAEEDEEESVILNKKFRDKSKSAHDHLTDPKLSSQPAVETPGLVNKKRKEDRSND